MFGAFDIGGTKMRVGVSTDGRTFSGTNVVETPANFDEGMETLKKLFAELTAGAPLQGLGGGMAGIFNPERTELLASPHLPGWVGQPLSDHFQGLVQGPVTLDNDSAVVGLGEAHFGAGQGIGVIAYITVSTGVGGARIIDGQIDRSIYGFEPGHQILNLDKRTTLEQMVSGTALEAQFGRKPFEIKDNGVWAEVAKKLAAGLYNTILHWSPEVVILGGSMFRDPGIKLEEVKAALIDWQPVLPVLPELKLATLGDQGGLFGGLILAVSKS